MTLTTRCARALAVCAALLATSAFADDSAATTIKGRHFDLLIRGGEIIDGTGAPRYRADIGIDADEIAAIGHLPTATANRTVDARDRIVTPGFVDMHAHVTDGDFGANGLLSADRRRRAAQNFVAQGITTAVANPDGRQAVPLPKLRRQLTRNGFGLNVVLLNGHSDLRRIVMKGDTKRPANAEEIRRMQQMLQRSLAREDSFGVSLGIEYSPAIDTSVEEELALGEVLRDYNGIFTPHLRSQGIAPMWFRPSQHQGVQPPTLDDSIEETLRVAEETGATVVFTHMKAWGPGYRGNSAQIIARLQAARDRGARVFMDVYPYDSSGSDGDFVAIPPWAFGPGASEKDAFDYRQALDAALASADASWKQALAIDIRHQIALKGGAENVRLLEFPNAQYVGKSYAELMQLRGLNEVDLAITLQREGDAHHPGGAHMRSFSMAESDIESFYRLDWCAVSTDGWVVLPEEAIGELKYVDTNRRLFGSYPRRLAYYSLERKVDTLEHAVRAASGLPAQILNLNDRGRIAVGLKADVLVLNLAALRDNTTYVEPSAYPSGLDYVLVNGRFAIDSGERTLALSGRVLQPPRPGTRSARE